MERGLNMLHAEYTSAMLNALLVGIRASSANDGECETERDKARAEAREAKVAEDKARVQLEKATAKQRDRDAALAEARPAQDALRAERDEARAELAALRAGLEAERAEHAKQLLAMRNLRFHETGRVIVEIKGEADRLKAELGLAKETASRHESELDALAEKLEALECDEGAGCTVCLVRPAQIAAVPCGHRFVCTREIVLFIGTRFSDLYTSVHTPA